MRENSSSTKKVVRVKNLAKFEEFRNKHYDEHKHLIFEEWVARIRELPREGYIFRLTVNLRRNVC